MPRAIQVITRPMPIAACVLVVAAAANAQSSEVVFQGLTHAAVGRATLQMDRQRDALLVRTLDPAGEDGVIVDLPDVEGWFARMESTSPRTSAMTTAWHAMADSRRISTAALRRSGKHFALTALFTGSTRPTYAAYVYNGGRLVGALGSLPPTAEVQIPESFCEVPEFAQVLNCPITSRFHNTFDGECVWELLWERPVPVRLPNGATVIGNEVRLVEEVRAASHYPYVSFDAMVIQTNTELALLAEGVR